MIVMTLLNPPRRYWNIYGEQPVVMQRMGSTLIRFGVLRRCQTKIDHLLASEVMPHARATFDCDGKARGI